MTELSDSLEAAVAAWEHAQQAATAINSIRDDFEQSALDFEALEAVQADLLDFVRLAARECHECHAVHSDHDHAVTDDRENIREFLADGATETPVGVSDETADVLGQVGVNPDSGSDSDSQEFRRAQQDGYLRVSDAEGVEDPTAGLGEFGARAASTRGLEEFDA